MNEVVQTADFSDTARRGDGRGVRVAVLDSGIERSHPKFKGASFDDELCFASAGNGDAPKNAGGTDFFGHGTAVAAALLRAAPAVTLGSFRVLGSEACGRVEIIRCAALEVIARGYYIIHCSFGAS